LAGEPCYVIPRLTLHDFLTIATRSTFETTQRLLEDEGPRRGSISVSENNTQRAKKAVQVRNIEMAGVIERTMHEFDRLSESEESGSQVLRADKIDDSIVKLCNVSLSNALCFRKPPCIFLFLFFPNAAARLQHFHCGAKSLFGETGIN